jgi:hypothetical protein
VRLDITTVDLRHKFDPQERIRLAEDLAHTMLTKQSACKLFASAKKAHEEAVEKLDATITDLSRKLCEGWEYRDIRCKVLWNDPEIGKKTFVRLDTGEIAKIDDMTDAERQDPLPLTGD